MYQYTAKLIRVVDGDTLDCLISLGFGIFIKERVRLMGIDTPESRTRNKAEKSWGLAAKDRLKKILKSTKGEFIITTKLQKKGKFGRILGEILIPADMITETTIKYNSGNISVNQILMEEKLPIPYTGGNKEESRKEAGVLELWNTYYSK